LFTSNKSLLELLLYSFRLVKAEKIQPVARRSVTVVSHVADTSKAHATLSHSRPEPICEVVGSIKRRSRLLLAHRRWLHHRSQINQVRDWMMIYLAPWFWLFLSDPQIQVALERKC